jgi:hypothetical protein
MPIKSPPPQFQGRWEVFRDHCQHAGIPLFTLTEAIPPAHLFHLWTADEAQQFGAVPAGLEDDQLTVAMTDPCDTDVIAALADRTGYRIFPVLARVGDVNAAIARMVAEDRPAQAAGD